LQPTQELNRPRSLSDKTKKSVGQQLKFPGQTGC
jgi:hypothetical protein